MKKAKLKILESDATKEEFSLWLKEVRKMDGSSQSKFARKLKLGLSTYQKWEQGVRLPRTPVMAISYIYNKVK